MKNFINYLFLVTALTLYSCSSAITPSGRNTASFKSPFELTLGEQAVLPKSGQEIVIDFLTVSDNRCPEDVKCITGGKATAELLIKNQAGTELVKKLEIGPDATLSDTIHVSLNERNYRIVLDDVSRISSNKATFTVSRESI